MLLISLVLFILSLGWLLLVGTDIAKMRFLVYQCIGLIIFIYSKIPDKSKAEQICLLILVGYSVPLITNLYIIIKANTDQFKGDR